MKITYLIPGSGGTFYCGNCHRDLLYIRAIKKVQDFETSAIPLYLPPDHISGENDFDPNVFFGAISMYLREKVPFFEQMPAFMDKLLDSSPMLKIAARRAGTTRTEGLEDLTINMINGENRSRELEVRRLANYLIRNSKPDIIHISNALIIGLARQLKKYLDVRIVCSLQNEDDWINEMAEPYQGKAWKMISEEAVNIDAFISPSRYYKDFFVSKTGYSGNNIHIIPSGIDVNQSIKTSINHKFPAIGYYCRVNYQNGFDKLVDAFIDLKSSKGMHDLTLHVCGGYTADDKPFINEQIKKIRDHGYKSYVKIYPEFHGTGKQQFFSNIDIMSVPVRKYDGYGLYLLEANAAGVPVVQPATGGFPEIIEITKGGIIYQPDTVDELSASLYNLLKDVDKLKMLGENGRSRTGELLSLEKMSIGLSAVYKSVLQ
jgi:glycosyltransferase involved in cell wall biosynthesis